MTEKAVTPSGSAGAVNGDFGVWTSETAKTTGFKVLLYGTSGSGKTYCAASFPKPLFVDMEGGMRGIGDFNPLRLPKDPKLTIASVEDLKEAYKMVSKALKAGNAPFETVVLDSLSEMQELVMRDVLATFSANRQYADQPTQADYGKSNRDFLKIFNTFLRLPCHVVFTNVVAPQKFEDDQLAPSFVGKQIGPEVSRLVDAIGFTYTVPESGENKVPRYVVRFANTPKAVAKDRLKIGPVPKPNNFNEIFKHLLTKGNN